MLNISEKSDKHSMPTPSFFIWWLTCMKYSKIHAIRATTGKWDLGKGPQVNQGKVLILFSRQNTIPTWCDLLWDL
jgi:hypothetical protein